MYFFNSLISNFLKKPKSERILVITPHYPTDDSLYRFQFLHRRLISYKEKGLKFEVFRFNSSKKTHYGFEGIEFTSGTSQMFKAFLRQFHFSKIIIHFLTPEIWKAIKEYISPRKLFIWVHGAEAEPWQRRAYDYNGKDKHKKIKLNCQYMEMWQDVLLSQFKINYIFPSESFKNQFEINHNLVLSNENGNVIHNFIDTQLFNFIPKDARQRLKILSIRPYASLKYANDLIVKAIEGLSEEAFFSDLEFRIIGDGLLFDETVDPIKRFKNVIIEKRFLPQGEIAKLHKEYGLFLVPTRQDSQGVSRDEAMSSGLVALTNRIPAIEEFCDDECAILAPPEDYNHLIEGIKMLYHDPQRFLKMSECAANKVRSLSSDKYTIDMELRLLND